MTASTLTSYLKSVRDLAERLGACRSPAAFSAGLVSGIRDVVHCDQASLGEIDLTGQWSKGVIQPTPLSPPEQAIVHALLPAHPIVRHYLSGTDRGARALSDFWTQLDLRRSPIYAHYYRARGIRYQLVQPLPGPDGARRALVLSRSAPDYSRREREVLEIVGSLTACLEELITTKSLVSLVLAAPDDHSAGVIVLDCAGSIEHATDAARSALARYFPGWDARQLPGAIADWITSRPQVPLAVTGPDGLLSIGMHADAAGRSRALLLRECPRQPDLTPRERQVLAMLAAGLPNKTIARQLRIGIPTVKSHAAAIYRKLKAGSRTEAVTVAIRRGLIDLRETTRSHQFPGP